VVNDLPANFVTLDLAEQGEILEQYIYVGEGATHGFRDAAELFPDDPILANEWIGEALEAMGLRDLFDSIRRIDLVRSMTHRKYELPLHDVTLYFMPEKMCGAGNPEIFAFKIWDKGGTSEQWYVLKEKGEWIRPRSGYLKTCDQLGVAPYYSS